VNVAVFFAAVISLMQFFACDRSLDVHPSDGVAIGGTKVQLSTPGTYTIHCNRAPVRDIVGDSVVVND
jgi:hypothetical protein